MDLKAMAEQAVATLSGSDIADFEPASIELLQLAEAVLAKKDTIEVHGVR